MEETKEEIFYKAMAKAREVIGVDPAYFGDEGTEEVARQLKEMGYDIKDFLKKD